MQQLTANFMSSSASDSPFSISETGDFGKPMNTYQILRAARNCDQWIGMTFTTDLVRDEWKEFGYVEYRTVKQNGFAACPNHPYSGANSFGRCSICGYKII